MKAAVVIDSWKSAIFVRHLTSAGFSFERGPGITLETIIFKVETPTAEILRPIVEVANKEASLYRRHFTP